MNLEIVLATSNEHKVNEYRKIFKGYHIVFYSLKDLNLNVDVNENGKTYKENALIKARAIANIVNFPVLADDSGIEISALDNKPGIKSARFAKENGGNNATNELIINLLKDKTDRSATFKCAIALITNNKEYIFEGNCPGYILDKPVGENGFGYDPIFFSKEANMAFGEASEEIKNTFSHRAKASLKLKTLLTLLDYKL